MEQKAKPIAAGFELKDGSWVLSAEGVLTLSGKGVLGSGMYHIYKSKIKKVVAAGFEEIAAGLFVGYPHLEAVEFGESVQAIGAHSFADCPKLVNVVFPGEAPQTGAGAFENTPWNAAQGGESRKADAFLASPRAQDILEKLNSYLREFFLPQDKWMQNRDEVMTGIMLAGVQSGEPALMYLWAELLFWGKADLLEAKHSCWMWFSDLEEEFEYFQFDPIYSDTFYWYERAAEAGFTPAICWMYWCCRRGIRADEGGERTAYWLEKARTAAPVSTFELEELNMICEIADELEEDAHWADIEEDDHCDDPGYVINPGWRELHENSLSAYSLGCALGVTACVPQEGLFYDYDIPPRFVPCYLLVEKRCWQIWCALNSVGLKDVSGSQINRWLNEAIEFMEEMQEEADTNAEKQVAAQMDQLLRDLTRDVAARHAENLLEGLLNTEQ